MLDLKFIREHADQVRENTKNRLVEVDVNTVIDLYDRRNALLKQLEELRARRNETARQMKAVPSASEREALIEEGKQLKSRIPEKEEELRELERRLYEEAGKIPNMTHPDAPVGADDTANRELRRVGSPTEFSFTAKDHLALGTELDLLDFEAGATVSGAKFYYLRNEAAFLELALMRYALDIVTEAGFTPTVTPDIAREEVVAGVGFQPRGPESNIYTLEGGEGCLIGTAEITLGGYYLGRVIPEHELPIKLAGMSHCFRREAGAAGQFSKGLYRVHQFSKVEMFVYTRPEDSDQQLEELLELEERIMRGLEVPYRVVDTCTGDLGGPAYRKYDIEAWMPGRGDAGDWGEVTSTSNCTDYQARRLNVRSKGEGKPRYLHMLNGTAIAVSRAIIALLENHQDEEGGVAIPSTLQPYTGFARIAPRG